MLRKFLGLLLLIFSVWLLLLATGLTFPYKLITNMMEWLRFNPWKCVSFALIALLAGLYLVRDKRVLSPNIHLSRPGNDEIRISQAALEDLIRKSVSGIAGLQGMKIHVRQLAEGLIIKFYCRPDERFNITADSIKIQNKISEDLEQYTGIKVKEVNVLVSPQGFRQRVWKK